MRVGLVTGRERIELKEFPEPEPEPGKAVVEIAYCGICGTDLHPFHTGDPYNPAICGHEWTGSVSALGQGVTGLKVGDRVGIGATPACGQCANCRAGHAANCTAALTAMVGVGPLAPPHGGFARAIAVDARRLYRIDPKLSDEQAAILEPVTVALHAVRQTPMRLGDSAVVLGAGPIGLLVLQCARAAGAGCVVVVEPNAGRARLAAELGASAVFDPSGGDVAAGIAEKCGALGADVVFECAGIASTIEQSVSLVRRGGVVSLVGLASEPAEISPGAWLAKEVRLVASFGYLHEEFGLAMQLSADGRLRPGALHTSTVGLAGLEAAFHRLLEGGDEVKVLVDPNLD
jgi:(R,R)-butanediol dehydrogenase/meso-butanediol dehydrogenase/diacetyl reductase